MDEDQSFTDKVKHKFFRLIFVIVAMFILSFAVLFLWNAILPQSIGLKAINYWQALAILALSRLLFGNFNFGFSWAGKARERGENNKFINMNDKDEAVFKEEWKKRREKWRR